MEYFFYGRDRPGAGDLRRQTTEAHWSYMDGYADQMIARGPTLDDHEGAMTGSLHLVDLPGAEAARAFAYEEPFFKAGVFAEILIYRWRNELERTMWAFQGDGDQRFMVLAHARSGASGAAAALGKKSVEPFVARHADALIAYGPILSEGDEWMGTLMLTEVPDRDSARELIQSTPEGQAGVYERVEVHRWRFGGRPSAT